MPKTNWVVIPTLNTRALAKDAVESALAQDIGNVRVLVVDAASDDGTREWLRTQGPAVQVIHLPREAGVSVAWNRALSHTIDRGEAAAVLVINSDARLRPDAYRLLEHDGGLFVTCVGTSSGAEWPGGVPSGEKRPHPDFSCFLIRRECWERVGPFDEDLVIYCGDGSYHLRMHRKGIEAYCLDLPFWHYASGTLKTVDEDERQRILDRAKLDREAFESKWGFKMGSPEYYSAFDKKEEVTGCK